MLALAVVLEFLLAAWEAQATFKEDLEELLCMFLLKETFKKLTLNLKNKAVTFGYFHG